MVPAYLLSVSPLWYGVNLTLRSRDLPDYDNSSLHAPREYVELVRAIKSKTTVSRQPQRQSNHSARAGAHAHGRSADASRSRSRGD